MYKSQSPTAFLPMLPLTPTESHARSIRQAKLHAAHLGARDSFKNYESRRRECFFFARRVFAVH
jgi:hypothetical protein